MGCLFTKFCKRRSPEDAGNGVTKQFSWRTCFRRHKLLDQDDVEKREKINVKDYIIEDVKNGTYGRVPGSVDGQQFIIQNCEDANIYILDHIATVTIDDCVNCRIFLGPIKTSLFIRNCKNCKLVVACQQFRARDCTKVDVFLCCATKPIIESSTAMRFGCYQFHYPQLEDQFKKAGLSVFNNNWSQVYDFTDVPEECNYSLLPDDARVDDYVPAPTTDQFSEIGITRDWCKKVIIPKTHGEQRKWSDESCLVIFFNDGGSHDRALMFIEKLKSEHPDCVLVQSKEVTMEPEDALRVFGTDSYQLAVQQGSVIGLELNGDKVISCCQDLVVSILKGTTGLVFVSQTATSAAQQIENFYNFADMQMKV